MTPADLLRIARQLIDLVLRYLVPGGAAALVFGALQKDPFAAYRLSGTTDVSAWLVLLSVLVVGPTIYAIHRALLHLSSQHVAFFVTRLVWPSYFLDHKKLDALLEAVVLRRSEARADGAPWITVVEEWSAQVHFLYCSCWGLLTAFALHLSLGTPRIAEHLYTGSAIALVLVFFAAVSDMRALKYQLTRTSGVKGAG